MCNLILVGTLVDFRVPTGYIKLVFIAGLPMQGRLLPVVWPSLTKQIYGAVKGRFGSFVTTVHGNPLLPGCRRRRGKMYTYTLYTYYGFGNR